MTDARAELIARLGVVALTYFGVCGAATADVHRIPNSWCEANGERWGEMGYVCHTDSSQRRSIICIDIGDDGKIYSAPICSTPPGFENAHTDWPPSPAVLDFLRRNGAAP